MRDDLTLLVQRIHPRADDFEIFEFFSQAGKVRDIRLIRDQRSGKSKGVGYVEFGDAESVMKALALNGIAFKGQPLLVQASCLPRPILPYPIRPASPLRHHLLDHPRRVHSASASSGRRAWQRRIGWPRRPRTRRRRTR